MTSKRRSAFSVYSETIETENKGEYYEKPNKNGKNRIHQNGEKSDWEGQIIQKFNGINKRNESLKKKNKKEKKKFHKLSSQALTESLNMFKSESKTLKMKNFPDMLTLNAKSKQKLIENGKEYVQFDKPSSKKLVNQKKELENILNNYNLSNKKTNAFKVDPEMMDSRLEAKRLFGKIINPVKLNDFFSNYWEKGPLLIRRQSPDYYNAWFSCKEFDSILRDHRLEFTTNIDVTTYINDVKQKHNPEGRAYPSLVWDFFQQGCSIRLLNPQTYSEKVWRYLSLLQELFGTCVGANVYLTPAGTQGFAPHYDDIEAFVLQLEGKKRWRVYKPLKKQDVLPRFSSNNFSQADVKDPVIDVTLEAGDLLYFPRGWIHQANACDDMHSLHITVSCYQKNSWGDFLQRLLPGAIEIAMEEDVEYRRGLPINYLINNGIVNEEDETNDRNLFKKKASDLIKKLVNFAPIDAAVDQMGKNYIEESLPPCFTENEKSRSIHGHGERWNAEKSQVEFICEIEPDTAIKLIRKNCLRLVCENDSFFVYHNLDNARVFREKEPQYLEVEPNVAPAIEFLIKSYPHYVQVEELPLDDIDQKITFASCLYDKGLIVTGEPLGIVDDESGSFDGDHDEYGEEDENEKVDSSNQTIETVDEDDNNVIDDNEEQVEDDAFNSEDYDNFGEEDESEGNVSDDAV